MVGWVGSLHENNPMFPLLNGDPLPSSVLSLLPLPPPIQRKGCPKSQKYWDLEAFIPRRVGTQWPPGARSRMRAEPHSSSSFVPCSPDSFVPGFLLTMKNCDLSACVLIDSRGKNLPKQKIILTKNILCHSRTGKLEWPFPVNKAFKPAPVTIYHSFIHSVNSLSIIMSLNPNYSCSPLNAIPR